MPGAAAATLARVTGVVVAGSVLYALLPLRDGRWWIGALVGLVAVVAVVPMTVRRLRSVRTSTHPLLAAAEAIALLLTMVVLGFSAIYLTIDRRAGQFDGIDTRLDAVYFTVTTLSTVGFGDVTATGQVARAFVIGQVLFDLTLFAVAIRVLADAAQRRRAEHRAAGEPA